MRKVAAISGAAATGVNRGRGLANDRFWPIAAYAGVSGNKQTAQSGLPPTEFAGTVKQCRLHPSCLLPT